MSETCPKTGLRCIPGLCINHNAVKTAYFEQDLEAARLQRQADALGLKIEEGVVYIEGNLGYRRAVEKTLQASNIFPCSSVCLS